MLPSVSTLTSICEDGLLSGTVEQHDLKPFNPELINEEYLNRISFLNDENIDNSSLYSSSTNYKHLFRLSHMNVSHPARSSLWLNLLRQDQTRHQHKLQQALERYPEDIRYVSFTIKCTQTLNVGDKRTPKCIIN